MDITIDTSAIIAVITNEPTRKKIIGISKGCGLIAPYSVHWEIGNALSAMIKRQRASLSQAKRCLSAYSQIPIRFVDADLSQSMELANSLKMYAYDAYLVRCALEFGGPLLTLDSGLKQAARSLGVDVLEI